MFKTKVSFKYRINLFRETTNFCLYFNALDFVKKMLLKGKKAACFKLTTDFLVTIIELLRFIYRT